MPEKGAIKIGPFGSALKKHEYSTAGIRVLGIEDVMPNRLTGTKPKFIPQAKYEQLSQYTVKAGDVLVTNMGTVGRACVVPPDLETSIISSHLIKVSLEEDKVYPPYVCWALNCAPSVVAQIVADSHGAIMAGFNSGLLRNLRIPLPPIAEQRRVAEVLDRAEALRAKRRAAIARLDALTRSIFLDTFGEPVTNPMGWPVVTLGDLLSSATYGTSRKAGETGALPILRMSNITATGEVVLSDLKRIDLPPNEMDQHTVRKGDVLFNRTNSADLVGKSAVVRTDEPMAYAGYLVRLRCGPQAAPDYVGSFLNLPSTKLRLRSMCKSIIGMANINAREVQGLSVPAPPRPLQDLYASRITAECRLRDAFYRHLDQLDALFASLQQRAFRGEL